MKNLTKSDVQKEVEELCSKQGTATTLEIKNILRSKSFKAEQRAVSQFMSQLYSEMDDWEFVNSSGNGGGFRIYSINCVSTTKPANNVKSVSSFKNNKYPKKDVHKIGDWVVSSRWHSKTPSDLYLNRGWYEAKYDYAKKHGIKYFDVRIRKA